MAVLEAQVTDLRERDRRTYNQANLTLRQALTVGPAYASPDPEVPEAIETAVAAKQESHEAHELATAAMQVATRAQEAHQQNVKLLNAVRETQSEHTQTLARHGEILAEHGERLDRIEGRLDGIEGRLDGIEGNLGTVTAGVQDIQLMLRGLIQREGGEQSSVS